MRKPRDFDTELKALADKARNLQQQKLHQLGDLVTATGAAALSPEHLAGALLAAAEMKDDATKEAWRKRGAAFFQSRTRKNSGANAQESGGTSARAGGAASPASADGASG
ncbi:phosphoribosyl-AMP cyclohydrolase [Sphingomonas kyeonggiensis]|uniref:conjugal transfer protein TraD n=1 Tax=Sphingomonas kyeonggiensis TaxID=1268553 RepID=UPI002783CE20|nr:conjugal transfer protein TraD [Sphingomonas kyeonggiensis]MDQ0251322.1 phosphoribosyl-AMP cyclohydrolase [Sphingomonas kyeonggiensis]